MCLPHPSRATSNKLHVSPYQSFLISKVGITICPTVTVPVRIKGVDECKVLRTVPGIRLVL